MTKILEKDSDKTKLKSGVLDIPEERSASEKHFENESFKFKLKDAVDKLQSAAHSLNQDHDKINVKYDLSKAKLKMSEERVNDVNNNNNENENNLDLQNKMESSSSTLKSSTDRRLIDKYLKHEGRDDDDDISVGKKLKQSTPQSESGKPGGTKFRTRTGVQDVFEKALGDKMKGGRSVEKISNSKDKLEDLKLADLLNGSKVNGDDDGDDDGDDNRSENSLKIRIKSALQDLDTKAGKKEGAKHDSLKSLDPGIKESSSQSDSANKNVLRDLTKETGEGKKVERQKEDADETIEKDNKMINNDKPLSLKDLIKSDALNKKTPDDEKNSFADKAAKVLKELSKEKRLGSLITDAHMPLSKSKIEGVHESSNEAKIKEKLHAAHSEERGKQKDLDKDMLKKDTGKGKRQEHEKEIDRKVGSDRDSSEKKATRNDKQEARDKDRVGDTNADTGNTKNDKQRETGNRSDKREGNERELDREKQGETGGANDEEDAKIERKIKTKKGLKEDEDGTRRKDGERIKTEKGRQEGTVREKERLKEEGENNVAEKERKTKGGKHEEKSLIGDDHKPLNKSKIDGVHESSNDAAKMKEKLNNAQAGGLKKDSEEREKETITDEIGKSETEKERKADGGKQEETGKKETAIEKETATGLKKVEDKEEGSSKVTPQNEDKIMEDLRKEILKLSSDEDGKKASKERSSATGVKKDQLLKKLAELRSMIKHRVGGGGHVKQDEKKQGEEKERKIDRNSVTESVEKETDSKKTKKTKEGEAFRAILIGGSPDKTNSDKRSVVSKSSTV